VRVALALSKTVDARLAKTARRYGHEVVLSASDSFELVAGLDASRPEIALVRSAPGMLSEGVLAQCDARGIRVLAVVETDAERRHAREVGLYETISAELDWPAIDDAVHGADAEPQPMSLETGSVIAVWGPAGAPGRTTIAIGIAVELAAAGYTVALADVDPHSASVAPALGMLDEAPGFAAACRLAGNDSLTRAELERIGQRYTSGGASFWVLTGIGQPSRWPELSAQRVATTITECRSWVDFTVLDTGFSLENDEEISSDLFSPRRNAATVTALREADHIVAVGSAEPVGLSRFLRAHGDLLELAQPRPVTVVMNRLRASAIGLDPAGQVRQTLSRFGSIDAPVLVPFDLQGMDAALLAGRTLAEVAPKSAARLAVQQLVRTRLLPAREPESQPRGLLRRGSRA
jgi:MinD-like ATPase involved in chromosome partitioning or flagellar assembly